jgi:hypothetical protein
LALISRINYKISNEIIPFGHADTIKKTTKNTVSFFFEGLIQMAYNALSQGHKTPTDVRVFYAFTEKHKAIIASYRYYLIYFVLWTLYSNRNCG